ncbi:TraR/DksA family transcriptional regulator [Variovorax sp. JS1663]|uniref:TraR/DksA family transcriptional regulator n=1 Tax=Variovorax sp. JS1663 TaxID=1851577 RepID=UPI000B3483E0|nr:TraR/DksA family transcriptional regulator [Variovorax sp. JS1663]OUM00903.1 molecular chaperone DnaK [Variovorax sp. JS1663]
MERLSPSDRHLLSDRLEQMRQQVLEELRCTASTAGLDASLQPQDVRNHAEEAETHRIDDVRFAEMEIDRSRLRGIEQAQQRMAEGRYGTCADCGEEIALERLMTQPIAVRCAACQTTWEVRRRRGPSGPSPV